MNRTFLLSDSPSTTIAKVGFSRLKVDCIIGVEPWEREREQSLFVDLSVSYDISKCRASDSIEEALDYVMLSELCKKMAREGRYRLLESYGAQLLQALMQQFPIVAAKIRIEKPEAMEEGGCYFFEMEAP